MKRVATETGSIYEIDTELQRIRRLSGNKSPTARQGQDGEWKTYEHLSAIEVGKGLTIIWNPENTKPLHPVPAGYFNIPMTETSFIVSIEER